MGKDLVPRQRKQSNNSAADVAVATKTATATQGGRGKSRSKGRGKRGPKTEYAKQFGWPEGVPHTPKRAPNAAAGARVGPAAAAVAAEDPFQEANGNPSAKHHHRAVPFQPFRGPATWESEYDHEYDWPEGMPEDTTARPHRDEQVR